MAGSGGGFTSERGSPFTTAGFARMVERAGVEAKLGFPAHPHMLRHACGFALANRGHDTALQAYLGHRNIQHTVRYTELSPAGSRTSSDDTSARQSRPLRPPRCCRRMSSSPSGAPCRRSAGRCSHDCASHCRADRRQSSCLTCASHQLTARRTSPVGVEPAIAGWFICYPPRLAPGYQAVVTHEGDRR